jgi:D-inositol-3-phosphate glycosyltransferase
VKIDFVCAHVSPLAVADGCGASSQNVHVTALARELGRRGHQVRIFTRRDSATLPAQVRTAPGVMVEHVPAGPARSLPRDKQLSCIREFGAYLSDRWLRDSPDVVHAHYWMNGLAALAGARELRLPVIQTFHGLGVAARRHQCAEEAGPPARIRLEAAIARGVGSVLATCSDEVFELARMGVPRRVIGVVPSGVDTSEFTPEGPAARRGSHARLLTVGPLVRHAGFEEILRAVSSVPDCELVVAGGPAKAKLRHDREYRRLAKLASQLGISDRVKFTGRVGRGDLPGMFRAADLVVSVPWYNPSGLVPLEAMACGTPVVASAVGSHTDTVVDGTTGVLVPPREPQVLARTIRELLASTMTRQGYGIAAADRARARYSWERIGQETLAVYTRVRRARPERQMAAARR